LQNISTEKVEKMSIPKKYFWLKLKDTFFSNPKIKKLRRIAGGDTFSVIYLKLMLLSLKNDGVIELEGLEPTAEEELALILDEELDNIRITVTYLRQTGLISDLLLGQILMTDVPLLIGKESDSAERMRRLRVKQVSHLSHCDANVHLSDKNVTTELELKTELEKELEKDLSLTLSSKATELKSSVRAFNELRNLLAENSFSFRIKDNIAGFIPGTAFIVRSNGYMHNTTAGRDTSSADAQVLWDYLFKNKEQIMAKLTA
jgi:predicted phage replisome organizer